MYYVINVNSDGIYVVDELTKNELEGRLAGKYQGDKVVKLAMPEVKYPNYWSESMIIIKGEVVMPRSIRVVERFELP